MVRVRWVLLNPARCATNPSGVTGSECATMPGHAAGWKGTDTVNTRSVRTVPTNGPQQDGQVEAQRPGFDAFQVTLPTPQQLLRSVGLATPPAHLRQSGKAGTHAVACHVVRHDVRERDGVGAGSGRVGPWPDQRHVRHYAATSTTRRLCRNRYSNIIPAHDGRRSSECLGATTQRKESKQARRTTVRTVPARHWMPSPAVAFQSWTGTSPRSPPRHAALDRAEAQSWRRLLTKR
jgi:hypothetical protein